MKKIIVLIFLGVILYAMCACGNKSKNNIDENDTTKKETDTTTYLPFDIYPTSGGDLKIALAGHGSLIFEYKDKIIHVDPYSKIADYSKLPKADLIILTHEHPDHLDNEAIALIKKDSTHFIVSEVCREILGYGVVMNNGDKNKFEEIDIEAVPAYNMVNKKPDGEFYHPKGRGNGYVFNFGGKYIYVAGDTENIPEMAKLKGKVDVAFLPKNTPYTMDDDMFIDAVKKIEPKYLYPYHFTEFDESKIKGELKDLHTEILVRPMTNM